MQNQSGENENREETKFVVPLSTFPRSLMSKATTVRPLTLKSASVVPEQMPRLKQEPYQYQQDSKKLDDLERMLLHEDFPRLLALSTRVKQVRAYLVDAPTSKKMISSALTPEEVHAAVARMQQQLVRSPEKYCQTIQRGQFPITDICIDDSVRTLENEWKHLSNWVQSHQESSVNNGTISTSNGQVTPPPPAPGNSRRKSGGNKKGPSLGQRKEAIAVKYAKWQTDILMKWMIEHKDQPFPDQAQIHSLMVQTGLSQSQVVNWTTNVRKRNRKATCEGGKKPHHFIDFLFLAQDREDREKAQGKKTSNMDHNKFKNGPCPSLNRRDVVGQQTPIALLPQLCPSDLNIPLPRPPPPSIPPLHTAEDPTEHVDSSQYHQRGSTRPSTQDTLLPPNSKNESSRELRIHHSDHAQNTGSNAAQCFSRKEHHSESQTVPQSTQMTSDMTTHMDDLKNISLDPLPVDQSTDQQVLFEFADLWLGGELKMDILPSVTEDSTEWSRVGGGVPPLMSAASSSTNSLSVAANETRKRSRTPSLDLDSVQNEDLNVWATEMGLYVSV